MGNLYAEFMAAVEQAATVARCARGFTHPAHDTTTGRCPGHHAPTLPADQTRQLADTVRKEIRRA